MTTPTVSRRIKAGMPPGSLVPVGIKRVERTTLELIEYDKDEFSERALADAEECRALMPPRGVRWLNVIGIHEADVLQKLGDIFGIHALTLEDIITVGQRPRMEDYGDYLFIVLKMLCLTGEGQIAAEQLSIILGTFGVISFQEVPGDVFDPIRDRLRTSTGRLRVSGADYLAYRMLDAIIDNYFTVLEDLNDRIERVQSHVANKPDPDIIRDFHRLKGELIFLRKAIWPVREVIGGLQKAESRFITRATELYLRDAYEHTIQLIDAVETMRDTLASALDIYLSSMSNRMNEIMRVLTVISTLFIPLTFLVGVYGMNFKYMPELDWPYGYAFVWALMIAIVLGMLVFFRRRKWL